VVCRSDRADSASGLQIAAANKHLTRTMELVIQIPGYSLGEQAHISIATLAYPDITAVTNPVQPDLFQLAHSEVAPVQDEDGDSVTVHLPPFSLTWITL